MATETNVQPYYLFDNLFDDSLFRSFAYEPMPLYRGVKYHLVAEGELMERGGTPKENLARSLADLYRAQSMPPKTSFAYQRANPYGNSSERRAGYQYLL
ncbi:MAG TPA: hypothetical protein ENH60_07830 [Pricia sp.]|uniref:Uncharacterized protein n=1 Tax=Pricia antarctica TaxID=641691 RepID=A0A831VS56_9FLAO|nr:hypothetical protein [Pricia sp.]HEA22353.1 hypothetical protein [Pricia antarctica]